MSIFELMDQLSPKYTKTDLAIYENIKKFSGSYAEYSLPELVHATGFSQAALTRFAKKLGFSGFSEFQYEYKKDLQSHSADQDNQSRSRFYGQFLETTEKEVDPVQIHEIAEKILRSSHCFVAGYHLSSLPAQYLSMMLKFSPDVFSIYSDDIDKFPSYSPDDVQIIFSSYSGKNYRYTMEHLTDSAHRPYCILVTLTAKHPLRKCFDEVVVLPESKTIHTGRTVLTETLAYLLFCDLLQEEIHKIKKGNNIVE